MTFADYMERVAAKVRRDVEAFTTRDAPSELAAFRTRSRVLQLFDSAHVFNLGEAEDLNKAGEDLKDDLAEDFRDGVPAPFDNMIVAWHHPEGWGFEWHVKLGDFLSAEIPENQRKNVWMLTDLSEGVMHLSAFASCAWYKVLTPQDGYPLSVVLLPPTTERIKERTDDMFPKRTRQGLADAIGVALRRIALVSHPSNYIVRTEPKLTPREERRLREHKEHPIRKRPYYIVIEHDVLVDLNPSTRRGEPHWGEVGRSVAPHARRGHWMRLSERCKAARAGGEDRVWRRETYVGQREFEDEKNRYRVVLGKDEL